MSRDIVLSSVAPWGGAKTGARADDYEKRRAWLVTALIACRGNVTATAKKLGVVRSYVNQLLKQFELGAYVRNLRSVSKQQERLSLEDLCRYRTALETILRIAEYHAPKSANVSWSNVRDEAMRALTPEKKNT